MTDQEIKRKRMDISDLLTDAQGARDNANAAFSCLFNNLFLDADPNWMEYRGDYNHYATISGIVVDYLHRLEGTLEELSRNVDEKWKQAKDGEKL